jgi:CRISPR/Cas system-associated exonuclease Cas4 (RecB family)
MKQIVTQSMIKEIFSYKMGESCGFQVEAKYVHGIEFPSSEAMNLGSWFEWKCTGQTTKFGHVPVAGRLKPKKLTKKEIDSGMKQEDVIGDYAKKYKDALVHVESFKEMIKENDYEIIETGAKLHDKELAIKGDVDIIVRKRGEEKFRFIDTKFSGLMENKWEDMGWADESLEYKDRIMIQAVHYQLLGYKKYGYFPDFYFWVYSSTNTTDIKNIKVIVNPDRFNEHKIIVDTARKEFEKSKAKGWIPRPSPKKCGSCPLSEKCEHSVSLPIEQIVYY